MSTHKVEIEVLSPLHISGAGRELGTMEFLRDRDRVYLINEDKLVQALEREGLTGEFLHYLSRDYRPNLFRFLQNLPRERALAIREAACDRSIPHGIRSHFFGVRPQQWDPVTGSPVLPGSAVKGALRNLVLYLCCRKDKALRERAARAVAAGGSRKTVGRFLDELLFAAARIPGARQVPNRDWFRTFQVSDFHTVQASCTQVEEVKVVSLNREGGFHFSRDRRDKQNQRTISIFVETISPGTVFTGTITCPPFLQGLFQAHQRREGIVFDPPALLSRLDEKADILLAEERAFFARAGLKGIEEDLDALAQRGANFRLGWGTGLLSMTVNLALSQEERLAVGQKYFKGTHHGIFPRSRKVVVEEGAEPVTTLGWARMKITGEEGKEEV